MIISAIENAAGSKYKFKVFIDDEFAFILYKGELSHYGLAVDMELSEELFSELNEIVFKRGKEHLSKLICEKDRTEFEIRENLKKHFYSDENIERLTELARDQGFVNDRLYASDYVSCYAGRKSLAVIKADLMRRGVSSEYISLALEELSSDDEKEGIIKLLKKKYPDKEPLSYEEKNKLFAYLGRKGYSFETIRKAFDEYISD